MYSALGNVIYSILFIISMMLPIYVSAENEQSSPYFIEQEVIDEYLDTDSASEKEEDNIESDLLEHKAVEPFFSFLDTPHEYVSSGVETFAKNIDEFFSDDKIFYATSGTYLRLRADTIFNEGGERTYQGDIKLKLILPRTKKKLKLTFESDINERSDDNTAQGEDTPIAVIEEKDYFAGIQATLGKENAWQFKPSIGLRLSSPIEPYFKLRIKRKYAFSQWSIHFHETPYWFDSSGWGSDTYLEFNNKITADALFRASSFARWTNEIDEFELSQVFSMYHTLSKRRAVSYFVGVYGKSEPTVYATHYLLGLKYRQNIHKDYLFVEILPQIKYEKINDFHADHSITFRLEMVFKK